MVFCVAPSSNFTLHTGPEQLCGFQTIPIYTQIPWIERTLSHTKSLNIRSLCWLYVFTVHTWRIGFGLWYSLISCVHTLHLLHILKHLPDVNGWRMLKARVGVKTCHDGSLYYEQKHIYTLCTPMSIFDCLPLDCKLGMNAEFHLRRLCIWYAKMACPVCTAIVWHLFAPAKH